MPLGRANTLTKAERLCGKRSVDTLLGKGRWASSGLFNYCWMPRTDCEDGLSRIMVSIPKKNFKRAVRRNLLKRRVREAYRCRKSLLSQPCDILFFYKGKEIADSTTVAAEVEKILTTVDGLCTKRMEQ